MNPILKALFEASNAHDAAAYAALFMGDARVGDDGEQHVGREAIESWVGKTFADYHQQSQVTKVAEQDGEIVVTATVSGTFDGSPIDFDYHFTLEGDKIAALVIR